MSDVELLVLDGDSISYVAAAASEKRSILATHKESGKQKEFKHRTEFKQWLKDNNEGSFEEFDVLDVQTPEPLENTLHTVKMMIKGNCDKLGCEDYIIGLSGESNFRLDLPLPTKYKSNRDNLLRPLNLEKVQDYLIRHHKAKIVEGRECDDWQASWAYRGYRTNKKIVQVTIDKDARGVPGWMFNPDTMSEPLFVHGLGELVRGEKKVEGIGRKWFYFQTLVGDAVDGFKPCELAIDSEGSPVKYGEVSAFNDLEHCQTDKECWEAIVARYKTWYPEPVTYYIHGDQTKLARASWLDLLQMYVDCAHMQRWEGDRVLVIQVLEKLNVSL